MFYWYQTAQICYAYLWDVDRECPRLVDHRESVDEWRTRFCESDWFTRGW